MAEQLPYRLPRTVVPHRYQLEFHPNLSQGVFWGRAEIAIEVLTPTQDIVLNAVNLTLENVVVHAEEPGKSWPASVAYKKEEEQAVLRVSAPLASGTWTLSLEFRGVLGNDLRGFYRTTVKGTNGDEIIASTQCESTDARRIFPCWDEPDFKATFAITMVVPEPLTVLSNAHETSSVPDAPGMKRVSFAETMPMSTYLVALVVGPLELTVPRTVRDVPVRIAARPEFMHLTRYAHQAAVDALAFFESYFNIPYPADKLDHVAIPDFAAGAMENLGCVTYREEALLLDENQASAMEKMQVVSTIAHETAHMWFGDMVTMRWWNGLWLNEAFATFMQMLATDALHPEWSIWTHFGLGRAHAFAVDGLASTRPIEYPVGPPSEAWAMFDVLTYEKGGSVLRMMEQYLGPEMFRQGVTTYLNQHRFGNTETGDLWQALGEVSGQPIRDVMDSWVFQPGYPLVQAVFSQDRVLTLSQKPFRYQGAGSGTWQVPVVLGIHQQDGTHDTRNVLLGPDPLTMTLPDNTAWVLVNQGGWGFYRVAYDAPLWQRLTQAFGSLTPLERLSIVDDVWAGVLADEIPVTQAIQLWRTMKDERDPNVWNLVADHIGLLFSMADKSGQQALQEFVRHIAHPVLAEVKWEGAPDEDVSQSRLRAVVIRLLGTLGADEAVRAKARQRFISYLEKSMSIAPDLLNAVVMVVADTGDEEQWDVMYQQFKDAATPQDAVRYLYALADFPDPLLAQRTFDLCLSSEVRVQDGSYAIGRALRNRHVRALVWDLVEEHWDALLAKYPPFMLQPLVTPVAAIVEERLASRTAAWLQSHPIPEAARQITQTLEFQGIHQALARRIHGHLSEWVQG